MATIKTEEFEVSYDDSVEAKAMVFDRLLEWYRTHGAFSGESIMQCDTPQITAGVLLANLADDVFKFDCEWLEEQ